MAELQRLRGPHSSSVTERRRLRERAANSCITSLFMIKRFHVFKKLKQLIFFRWVVCRTIKTKQGGGEENMTLNTCQQTVTDKGQSTKVHQINVLT